MTHLPNVPPLMGSRLMGSRKITGSDGIGFSSFGHKCPESRVVMNLGRQ